MTSSSDRGYGSGFNSTPWMTLKIAVLAPMPMASVSTATLGEERHAAEPTQDLIQVHY